MIQKLKSKLLILSSLLFLAAPLSFVGASYAAADTVSDNVCSGASTLKLGTGTNNSPTSGTSDCTAADQTSKVNNLITTIINVFSVVVGVIAVIMIIVGGFRYITSGGDSTKVGSAKSTILYALIGLVIVALAQIIVKFVLNKAVSA